MKIDAFDLVVVGAGMAGLTAAVRAAEFGMRVCVLEQGVTEDYPCNTRYSGGIFHLAYHSVSRPRRELESILERATFGQADPGLISTLAEHAPRLTAWLSKQGATFIRGGAAEWCTWMLAPPRKLSAGLDWRGRGPDTLLHALGARLLALSGALVLGARATRLRMQQDGCTGVDVEIDGAARTISADAVVLADGGFQGNPEMVGTYVSRRPEALMQRGAGTGRGDALRMALEVGAQATRADRFYGRLLSRDAFTRPGLWPFPEVDAIGAAGVLVDAAGHRFADEGRGGIALANAVAQLDNPLSATLIFDQAIWDGPGRSARTPANPNVVLEGGTLVTAATLHDLAVKLEIPPAQLESTVKQYNAAVDAGALATLIPPRSSNTYAPLPIHGPVFHAMPVCAGITYTMGGICIDAHARVLRANGDFIPGLYAAGSCTGGLEGGERIGYTGGLVRAGVFALRAAECAHARAAQLRADGAKVSHA
ncbi:MAG: FAD-dependent oxidoreductase [Hyphomonadaceae bacterium]|nr:FAD-dependent oxidoreductase [Hyphomonadaceae bacterium]